MVATGLLVLDVRRGDFDQPARRHRVARVDRDIQDRQLQFIGIDLDRPKSVWQTQADLYVLAQRPVQDHLHRLDPRLQVHDLRLESGAPRESQQLFGQGRAPGHRLLHAGLQLLAPFGILGPVHQINARRSDHQQVVEVVSHAAGQPADRLHLLALAQGRLGLGPLGHFILETTIAVGEIASLGLEFSVGSPERRLGHAQQGYSHERNSQHQHQPCITRGTRSHGLDLKP